MKQHMGTIRSCSPSLIGCLSPVIQAVPTTHLSTVSSGPSCARLLTREKCACSPEPLWSGLSISTNLVWIGTFYFLASHIFYNTLLICVFSMSFKFKTGYFQRPVQKTPPDFMLWCYMSIWRTLTPHQPCFTHTSWQALPLWPTPLCHPGPHGSSPCEEGPHLGAFICHAPDLQAGLQARWGHKAFCLFLN